MSFEFMDYPDRDLLVMALVDRIAADLNEILDHRDRAVLAVPGGSSPGPVFDGLSAVDLDWSRVDVVLGDERWVPEDHDRSNTRLLRQRLLVNHAKNARYLPLYAPVAQPEAALDDLAQPIEQELPLAVALLGMGGDMHTASLFPGAAQLSEALAPDAPVLMAIRAPGAPEPRITLTARVLNGALRKHVLIYGPEKRAALDNAMGLPALQAPINAVIEGAKIHWAP